MKEMKRMVTLFVLAVMTAAGAFVQQDAAARAN
jgi:hypothetical protein